MSRVSRTVSGGQYVLNKWQVLLLRLEWTVHVSIDSSLSHIHTHARMRAHTQRAEEHSGTSGQEYALCDPPRFKLE